MIIYRLIAVVIANKLKSKFFVSSAAFKILAFWYRSIKRTCLFINFNQIITPTAQLQIQ